MTHRRIAIDKQITKPSIRGSVERQRERYKAAGLVQINVWIPAENRLELMQDCARLRHEHLKSVGFWNLDDESLATPDDSA